MATRFADAAAARRYAEQSWDKEKKDEFGRAFTLVLRGAALIKVRDEGRFPEEPDFCFEAWAEQRLRCKARQRDRIIAVGHLDPALVENKKITLAQMEMVSGRPPWLHETLIDLAERSIRSLAWVGDSAVKHLEEHHDQDAARQHARLIATDRNAKPLVDEPRTESTETLLKRVRRRLAADLKATTRLEARLAGEPVSAGTKEAELLAECRILARQIGRLMLSPGAPQTDDDGEDEGSTAALTPEPQARVRKPSAGPKRNRRVTDRDGEDDEDDEDDVDEDEEEEDDGDEEEDEDDQESEDDDEEEGDELECAPRPHINPQGEALLAIPHDNDPDFTLAEVHMRRLVIVAHRCTALLDEVFDLRIAHWPVLRQLQLEIHDKLVQTVDYVGELKEWFGDIAAKYQGGAPPVTLDAVKAEQAALEFLVYGCADPFNQDVFSKPEPLLWHVNGLLDVFDAEVQALATARRAPGPERMLFGPLVTQFMEGMLALKFASHRVKANFFAAAMETAREQEAKAKALAAKMAALPPGKPPLISLGTPDLPSAYGVVGLSADGRTAVEPLDRPKADLIIGGRGAGKTHRTRVSTENLILTPPGLCRMDEPQRVTIFETDVRRGQGRYEMLRGFYPNSKPADLRRLRDEHNVRTSNLAFTRGLALVHPYELEQVRKDTAVYRERGLQVEPLLFGPQDLGGYALGILFAAAIGGAHWMQHPMYLGFVKTVSAEYGDRLTWRRMRREIIKSKLDSRSKDILLRVMDLLRPLWSDSGSILNHLQTPWPLFVILRSRYLSADFALALQAALFNALSRSPPGDAIWWRTFFLDELAKLLKNPVFTAFVLDLLQELRHNYVSFTGCVQHLLHVPAGMLPLFSNLFLYRTDDAAVLRRVKAETGGLPGWTARQLGSLESHSCLWYAPESNDEGSKEGLVLRVRPTLMCAGGETLRQDGTGAAARRY